MSESNNHRITDAELRAEIRTDQKWIIKGLTDNLEYMRELSSRIKGHDARIIWLEARIYIIGIIAWYLLDKFG